jgi:hypothetical protein
MTVFTPTKATGSHFYKYQSAERLERLEPIILKHELYLPSVAQLNDPQDCKPKLAPMSEDQMYAFLLTHFVWNNPTRPLQELEKHAAAIRANIRIHGLEWFLREASKLLNKQMEQFRVYSLSKRFDNLSLWAKYAGDHTGYCLEFSNEGPLFGERTFEVSYEDLPPFSLIDSEKRDARFLVYKNPDWRNEEEVRLIRARGSQPGVKIEPQWLTRIILGKDMLPDNRKQIREWAKLRQPELVVVQAFFDDFHQALLLK